ncbi:MAG: tetratricopeptide repeat protein, partial [Planctomycetota bacterium]
PRSVAEAFAAYVERHRERLGPEWAAALLAFERYARHDNAERSIALYEQALAQAPPCFYVETCLGDLQLNELGNVRRALHHFRASADLAPDLAMPRYSLGLVLHLLGVFEQSREQYELAIELAGDDGRDLEVAARASFNVAVHHINRGRSAEAEPLLRRALELMPDYPEARRAAAALGLDGDPLAKLRSLLLDRMRR